MDRIDTQGPATASANAETRCVFELLQNYDGQLFGHQDTLAYGVNWFGEEGRSDVFETVGAYPSVLGWDIGELEFERRDNLDNVDFGFMKREIVSRFRTGSLSTVSWHVSNPITNGQSWDRRQRPTVEDLLPGGAHHATFELWLDRVIRFFRELSPTPILFRPFHEMNGDWFWWGGWEPESFIAMWQYIFEKFEAAGVQNALWVYAPNAPSSLDLVSYYPGDEYVDVIAMDDYSVQASDRELFGTRLRRISSFASDGNKIAALAETGLEGLGQNDWFTQVLGPGLSSVPNIRYAMVWRNANAARDRAGHFFAPYPEHESADDFRNFAEQLTFASEFENPLSACLGIE